MLSVSAASLILFNHVEREFFSLTSLAGIYSSVSFNYTDTSLYGTILLYLIKGGRYHLIGIAVSKFRNHGIAENGTAVLHHRNVSSESSGIRVG